MFDSEILQQLRAIRADIAVMREDLRQSRLREYRAEGLLMSIQAEVQTLLNAVDEQGEAIAKATDELVVLEGSVVDLQAKLDAAVAAAKSGGTIDGENLAGIVSATKTISASVEKIRAAMPQPVAPAVVDAVAVAAPSK